MERTLDRLKSITVDGLRRLLRFINAQNLRGVLVLFTAWVLIVVGVSYFATNEFIGITTYESSAVIKANKLPNIPAPKYLGGLPKWDSEWYLEIALHGYHPDTTSATPHDFISAQSKFAFFPLFPTLLRAVIKLHVNPISAGFLINIVLSLGATLFLYLIAKDYFNDQLALRACTFFLFFPSAFFMLSIYSEALFCFLSFGAFYLVSRRQWLLANILLACCTATRIPGLIVALAIFIEYLSLRGFSIRKLDRHILTFLIAPLGFVAYSLYLWRGFGDPLLMIHVQKYWGQSFDPNIIATVYRQTTGVVENLLSSTYSHHGTDWGKEWTNFIIYACWLLGVFTAIIAWLDKKIPRSYIIYMALSLVFFISKGNFISVNRYILGLFPLYIVLAKITRKDEHTYLAAVAMSLSFMALGLVEFSVSYWTG